MTDEPVQLVQYDAARTALEKARSFDEVTTIRNQAEAMRAYARQAKDSQLELWAAEIRIRAERRAGEMIRDSELSKGGRPEKTGRSTRPVIDNNKPLTLADIEVSKDQSSQWQKLAAIPEPDFEAALVSEQDDERPRSSAEVIRRIVAPNASHLQSSLSNEWYTPAVYVEAARRVLGAIDLDPASCETANKTVQAASFFTEESDGLCQPWPGRVWLNPPYGGLSGPFTERLVDQHRAGVTTAAVLLVNSNSTDTAWFRPLWSSVLCFTDHRIDFVSPSGSKSSSTHGSVFAYFGDAPNTFQREFEPFGVIVVRRRMT